MLINSELPLTMLDKNLELNEYDFVLFHLYKQYPKYREYYKNLRTTHPDRLMIFDNSAYEFFIKGEELDLEEFADTIIDLRPDLYILPDKLMDKEETLSRSHAFYSVYNQKIIRTFADTGLKCPRPMAVAQGNSADELFDCLLEYYTGGIKCVAIPFHNSFFKESYDFQTGAGWRIVFGKLTDDHRYALGRIRFVNENAHLLLKKFEHVHLLGSHCPYEKRFYGNLIKTMDTGYPVKCAIEGYEMFKEPAKPDIIIDNFMETPLTDHQKILIGNNINKFKSL